MNEQNEVVSLCPSNYKLFQQKNIPWRKIIESFAVAGLILYLLWTINFTLTIKFIGTVTIGIPLFFILLIGHRGKSIGQILYLSLLHTKSKVRLHLRSVNDGKSNQTKNDITDIISSITDKAKDILGKFSKEEQ